MVDWAGLPLRFALLAALLLALPGWALGQASGPLFPPSIAIANYNRVLVGAQEALEAGAFVARVGDATAGWYNPAGMASVQRSVIIASGTGFEGDLLALPGLSREWDQETFIYPLPRFLGAVLGRDVIDSEAWRIGFTVTKPVSWTQKLHGGLAGDARITYSSDVSFSTLFPMFCASYSPFPSLRFGAGLGLAVTSLTEIQTLSEQLLTPTTANAFLRTLEGRGSAWNLTGNLGVQWDVTANLVLGALVQFPGLKVLRSGRLTYQNVDNNGSPWSQAFFDDQSATFDYRLPLAVSMGLAWRSKAFEVEVDVRYYSAIGDYTLFASDQPVVVTTTGPTGLPVVTNTPFPGVTNGAKAVWNVAVGGRYSLDETWSIHGGFFTDASPTRGAGEALFRSVDMYGVTAGAKGGGEHLSGSFGLGYSWGRSPPFDLGATTGGQPMTTRLTIKSLYLLLALAYKF
jgi:long-subunit fatty acid transport protein